MDVVRSFPKVSVNGEQHLLLHHSFNDVLRGTHHVEVLMATFNLGEHHFVDVKELIDDFNFFDYDTSVRLLMKLYEIKPQVFISTNNTYLMKNDFSRPDSVFHMQNGGVLSIDNCTGKFIKLGTNTEKIFREGGFNFEQY